MDNKSYYSVLEAAANGPQLPKNGESENSPRFTVRKVDINAIGHTDQGVYSSYEKARELLEAIASLSGRPIVRNIPGDEVVIQGDLVFSIVQLQ